MTNPTNDLPGTHPPPPSDLSQRKLPLKIVEAETVFYRVHQAKYDPIYFSSSAQGRFNVPEGVIYLGTLVTS